MNTVILMIVLAKFISVDFIGIFVNNSSISYLLKDGYCDMCFLLIFRSRGERLFSESLPRGILMRLKTIIKRKNDNY